MTLHSIRQRLARIGATAATEESRPPQIRLCLAGAVPRVCRCGPALVTVIAPEDRRPELERQRAERLRITGQPPRDTMDEALAQEVRVTADLAGSARALQRVLGMNSEERADLLAELDAKRTTQEVT